MERYLRDLERAPLAVRTREAYGQHVGAYGAWLAGRPEPGVAITDPRGRDHATRDFKRHLKLERGWKPSSVNLALAAVDHFNRFLGLGPANVKREPLAQAAPKALSEEQQRALLRAAEVSRSRDRAIVTLLLYTALRLHELVDLDVGDVSISARKGLLVVRSGKGDAYREVPLNRSCRQALEDWLKPRATLTTDLRPVRWSAGPAAHPALGRSCGSWRRGARRLGALGALAAAYVRDQPGARWQRPGAGRRVGWSSSLGDDAAL